LNGKRAWRERDEQQRCACFPVLPCNTGEMGESGDAQQAQSSLLNPSKRKNLSPASPDAHNDANFNKLLSAFVEYENRPEAHFAKKAPQCSHSFIHLAFVGNIHEWGEHFELGLAFTTSQLRHC
jgi:hypothetical protein